jgi:hypothetical protein
MMARTGAAPVSASLSVLLLRPSLRNQGRPCGRPPAALRAGNDTAVTGGSRLTLPPRQLQLWHHLPDLSPTGGVELRPVSETRRLRQLPDSYYKADEILAIAGGFLQGGNDPQQAHTAATIGLGYALLALADALRAGVPAVVAPDQVRRITGDEVGH